MIYTNIGAINLSENQILNYVPSGIWTENFNYVDGEVIAHSEVEPQQSDIESLKAELSALPDTLPLRVIIERFDAELAIGREAQVFDASSLIRIMPFSYTINEMIRFKNFWGGTTKGVPYVGVQQVGQGLVAEGLITQEDYNKLAGILAEQGIII